MNNDFFHYSPQSQILQAANIPLPEALSDNECLNQNVVEQRFEDARRYKKRIKYECSEGNATIDDLTDANRGYSYMAIAQALPSIQRNLAPIGAQAVADIIMPQINAQFANMNASFINIHATSDVDTIVPKLQIPVPANSAALPADFPATKGALFRLTAEQIRPILLYYGLPDIGTVSEKKTLLAQHLGLPPQR